MDESLRAEDFRRAWPTALLVAMREVEQLTSHIESASAKVESANRDALIIAELLPKMTAALRATLKEAGEDLLSNSKGELNAVRQEIATLLVDIKSTQDRLDARLSDLEKSAINFSSQRELLRLEKEKRNKRWYHFF